MFEKQNTEALEKCVLSLFLLLLLLPLLCCCCSCCDAANCLPGEGRHFCWQANMLQESSEAKYKFMGQTTGDETPTLTRVASCQIKWQTEMPEQTRSLCEQSGELCEYVFPHFPTDVSPKGRIVWIGQLILINDTLLQFCFKKKCRLEAIKDCNWWLETAFGDQNRENRVFEKIVLRQTLSLI